MLFKLSFLYYVLCSHYADILNKVPPNSPLRLTLLNYKTQQNKTLKGLEQFRKHTPILSNALSFAPRLFLPTQHGLRFVAFNNWPFLATTPWDTFFSSFLSLPLTIFVPPCFYLLAAARKSEAYAAEAAAANFFQLLRRANPPLFFAAQPLYCSFIDWEVLCCSGINSWGDPSPTISLSVRPVQWEGRGGSVNPGIPGATSIERQECWEPLSAPHHLLWKATCAVCFNLSATVV